MHVTPSSQGQQLYGGRHVAQVLVYSPLISRQTLRVYNLKTMLFPRIQPLNIQFRLITVTGCLKTPGAPKYTHQILTNTDAHTCKQPEQQRQMWLYKRIHMNTNIQMHKYKHKAQAHSHICVHICVCVCFLCIFLYTCIYDFGVYAYIYVCKYVHTCMLVFVYMCLHGC